MSAGAQAGSTQKLITEFQAALHKYKLDFTAYNSMSSDEREKYRKDLEDKMGESGRSVQMMNDATQTFLQMQDAMTLPMQSTYELFDDLTHVIKKGGEKIKKFFGIDDGDGFGDYMEDNYQTEAYGHFPAGQRPTYSTKPSYQPTSPTSRNNFKNTYKPTVTTIPDPELRKRAEEARISIEDPSIRRGMTPDEILSLQLTIAEDAKVNVETTTSVHAPTQAQTSVGSARAHGQTGRGGMAGDEFNSLDAIAADRDTFGLTNNAQNRRMGGPVDPNKPYIVGDQLGMDNAELFVPDTAGNIINNRDLNTMISNLVSGQDLTGGGNGAIIEELKQEYLSLIESKTQTVQVMASLREAIRLFNDNKNRKAKIDIINSV
jgi:hypothetical protein